MTAQPISVEALSPVTPVAEIDALRQDVNDVDGIILRALSMRFQLTDRIGEIKATEGMAIQDIEREERVISRLVAEGKELGLSGQETIFFWSLIMNRSAQRQESIAHRKHDSAENQPFSAW